MQKFKQKEVECIIIEMLCLSEAYLFFILILSKMLLEWVSEKLLRCCVCVCGKAHCSFILILPKALLEWVMQKFKRKEGECKFTNFV